MLRKGEKMSRKIEVLFVEPGKPPRPAFIQNTLAAMEETLGGPIQIGCFLPRRVLLISREDTKGLTPNRCRPNSRACISGPFILCAVPEDESLFESLNAPQRVEFERIFANPGEFMMVGDTPFSDPDDVADKVYALWDDLKDGESMVLTKWGGCHAG